MMNCTGPGGYVMHNNPHLAARAMQCIVEWAGVERTWLSIYVQLAGGSKTDAVTVFLAIESEAARNAALTALAKAKLPEEWLELMRIVSKISRQTAKERHKLAHWIWGESARIPDALLLQNPRFLGDDQEENILVYTERDFSDIMTRIQRTRHIVGELLTLLAWSREHPALERHYAELCALPEIRRMMRQN
jgi:hypothetical protein